MSKSEAGAKHGKWHHFKKSFSKSVYYDPETKLETYPVWIFWTLGGCSVWWMLGQLFG